MPGLPRLLFNHFFRNPETYQPELLKGEELNTWLMAKLKEGSYQAKHNGDQRKGSVQQVVPKSKDILRRIIVPVEGQDGSHCRTRALTVIDIRLKVTSGGFRRSVVTAARRENTV